MLGGFQLVQQRTRVTVPGAAERLLAFLAFAGNGMQRGLIAGVLWPNTSERRAFGNLRSTLSRLGPGRPAVVADPLTVQLADDVAVDVRDARGLALRLLTPHPDSADLSPAAVEVLSEQLLPGWYDEWVLEEAEEWRQLRLHALEALAGHLRRAGRFGEAAVAAGACVRAEPRRESAHAALVSVHLAEGNDVEALRQLERFRKLLRAELGLDPSPRLTDLFGSRRLH